ncbi:twitching motility protein PilT [Thermococcus celericrescens]|uniref:Ribonuclease VapC n=1 Tax=Thermococcus celericrescens TaxID=227598 RepID=A0A100XVM1_9EURY|nr:PIN domain-containing protein [Thermococcus celericrescens]KUH31423.1 twitching motility protein PilT [Thermococcus celericrescens]
MILIPDTSALVELIRGSETGRAVEEILEDADIVLIPTLVLAELRSFLERNNIDPTIAAKVAESGLVVSLEADIAINAGALHAKIKRENKNVSLADCIIAETARKYDAVVLTTDHHFKLLGNAIILEK